MFFSKKEIKMTKKKVVLAYSGGVDTSVILKWLVLKGYEVITFTANIGQPNEDFDKIKEKSLKTGASKAYIIDLRKEFVEDYILPVFASAVCYENRYLLGTSIARPLITKKMIEIVKEENAAAIAHGCTGKGNDQVRFELSAYALKPDIEVYAPWRDTEFLNKFQGRTDLMKFAKENGIELHKVNDNKDEKLIVVDEYKAMNEKDYSEDANLLHISHEAGILEDPSIECPESVYSWVVSPEKAPDKATKIKLSFKKGILSKVENLENRKTETNPLEIFSYLNDLGAENGIGRLDMVENRYIGIKSRGVYETPGGEILFKGISDLYGLTMDKEVFRIHQLNSIKMSELIYNGYWFSPEMEVCFATARNCLKNVNGDVILKLYKGSATPVLRTSKTSLYNNSISSMDIHGGFEQEDSTGFIKINAVRLKLDKVLK